MSDPNRFESLIKRLPVRWETVLGMGLAYFIEKQEPEEVNFTKYNNGWSLEVKTDEESVQDAMEFWTEYVEDKI